MKNIYKGETGRAILVGDINARHRKWDSATNVRGRAVVKIGRPLNYVISPPNRPSCKAKGRVGQRKLDILLDLEKSEVQKPSVSSRDESSDQTPLIYKVKDINIKLGKCKIYKSMANNQRNIDETGEWYSQDIPAVTEKVKRADTDSAQEVLQEVAKAITSPWKVMEQGRS